MILQMRRNRHEVLTLMSTGLVFPPEYCEFEEASAIMEKMKVILMEHAGTLPSGYWFELVTKDNEGRERTSEIPAELDNADELHFWYLSEVQ